MKTPHCQDATDKAEALGKAASILHRTCPGASLTTEGEILSCDCECHPPGARPHDGPLPVVEPPSRGIARPGRVDGRKRPKRGLSSAMSGGGAGRCEHCGARTAGGRFAAGHDAKLKSDLYIGARANRPNDWAELVVRGWTHLVDATKVPSQTIAAGAKIAAEANEEWLARRNEARFQEQG